MPNQDHQRRTTYISRKDDTYYLDRLLDTFGWTLDSQMRPDAQLLSKSTLGNKIANDAFLESQALKHSIFNDLIPQNKPYETQLSELISLIKEMNLSKIKINHALNKILEHCPQIKKVGLNSKNWEVILRLIFHWRCSGTNVRELYLPSFKGWDKVFDDLLNHISKTFLRRIEFTSRHYPDYAGSEYENDRIEKLNAVLKANAE